MTSARSAALLLGAVVALTGCSDASGPDPSPGTPSHRVVYRVEETAGATPVITTYVVEHAGPYRARVRTLSGAPPGSSDLGGTAWDGERLYLLKDGRPTSVQDVAPGFTGAVGGLDVSLASAHAHGLVRRGGAATVAGLACTEWESTEPLDAGPWRLPTARDRAVSCVSADGVLLRERWTLDGRPARTRTAVSVGEGPTLDGPALLGGATPSALQSAPALEEVKHVDASTLLTALGIPAPVPPTGFALDRTAAVLQRELRGQPSIEGGVLVYRSGGRLVELRLERGLTGRALRLPAEGVPVRLAGGRTARLSPTYVGLRLSFLGGHGLLATVTANVEERALLDWAGGIRLP